jgi:hypothetical protein
VLLAKVQHSTNQLYVLCMQVTQPVNLVAKGQTMIGFGTLDLAI